MYEKNIAFTVALTACQKSNEDKVAHLIKEGINKHFIILKHMRGLKQKLTVFSPHLILLNFTRKLYVGGGISMNINY